MVTPSKSQFPLLTVEEKLFFKEENCKFFKYYNLIGKISLSRRVSRALTSLATYKFTGIYKKKNPKEAFQHFIKALQFDSHAACGRPLFRTILKLDNSPCSCSYWREADFNILVMCKKYLEEQEAEERREAGLFFNHLEDCRPKLKEFAVKGEM